MSIEQLPADLQRYLLDRLTVIDAINLSMTNRQWYNIASLSFWQQRANDPQHQLNRHSCLRQAIANEMYVRLAHVMPQATIKDVLALAKRYAISYEETFHHLESLNTHFRTTNIPAERSTTALEILLNMDKEATLPLACSKVITLFDSKEDQHFFYDDKIYGAPIGFCAIL